MKNSHQFAEHEIDAVYRAIRERRDMRHFLPDPIDPAQLARFIEAAHCGPSVGYMQPWRFVRISDHSLRRALYVHVQAERIHTANSLGERAEEFMRLKVEGILACGELLVVGLVDGRERYVFGRRTMPEVETICASP